MEFVELLLLGIAVVIMMVKPEKEKLAWYLTIGGWIVVVLMYVGHTCASFLGALNL